MHVGIRDAEYTYMLTGKHHYSIYGIVPYGAVIIYSLVQVSQGISNFPWRILKITLLRALSIGV